MAKLAKKKNKTRCLNCNKVLYYAERKPRYCPICKPKKAPTKPRKKKITLPKDSKLEIKVKYCLNEIFPEDIYIDNGFYSWLVSPKGYSLQLDRFYPELKIAFEIQGRQHYEFEAAIHRTEENFNYLLECDKIKRETCKDKEIILIAIHYGDTINKENLKNVISERTRKN